jgi:hypothetical protein
MTTLTIDADNHILAHATPEEAAAHRHYPFSIASAAHGKKHTPMK